MKTIISSLVLLGILALPGRGPLYAADPPKSLEKGKVLILKNEHTMEGDIERVGDRYRVRREAGETWVPADRALRVVASLSDAYAFLRSRANLEDPDERLRLAKWCRLNGLPSQALAEVRAAAELRPDHVETRRLLEHLKQEPRTAAEPKPIAPAAPPQPAEELPPVEVTTESLGLFATRVQPILMNTCARCHATGQGGKFHLTQVFGDGIGNRRALERNLSAVLAQINLSQPDASRLLTQAVIDHAHIGQAPLRDRQSPPYRTLERWIKLTVANNPHLRDSLPASAATPTPPPHPQPLSPEAGERGAAISPLPRFGGEGLGVRGMTSEQRQAAAETGSEWGADARPSAAPAASVPPSPTPVPVPVSNAAAAPPPPPPPVKPADPYDPDVFNHQAHPEATKPGPEK